MDKKRIYYERLIEYFLNQYLYTDAIYYAEIYFGLFNKSGTVFFHLKSRASNDAYKLSKNKNNKQNPVSICSENDLQSIYWLANAYFSACEFNTAYLLLKNLFVDALLIKKKVSNLYQLLNDLRNLDKGLKMPKRSATNTTATLMDAAFDQTFTSWPNFCSDLNDREFIRMKVRNKGFSNSYEYYILQKLGQFNLFNQCDLNQIVDSFFGNTEKNSESRGIENTTQPFNANINNKVKLRHEIRKYILRQLKLLLKTLWLYSKAASNTNRHADAKSVLEILKEYYGALRYGAEDYECTSTGPKNSDTSTNNDINIVGGKYGADYTHESIQPGERTLGQNEIKILEGHKAEPNVPEYSTVLINLAQTFTALGIKRKSLDFYQEAVEHNNMSLSAIEGMLINEKFDYLVERCSTFRDSCSALSKKRKEKLVKNGDPALKDGYKKNMYENDTICNINDRKNNTKKDNDQTPSNNTGIENSRCERTRGTVSGAKRRRNRMTPMLGLYAEYTKKTCELSKVVATSMILFKSMAFLHSYKYKQMVLELDKLTSLDDYSPLINSGLVLGLYSKMDFERGLYSQASTYFTELNRLGFNRNFGVNIYESSILWHLGDKLAMHSLLTAMENRGLDDSYLYWVCLGNLGSLNGKIKCSIYAFINALKYLYNKHLQKSTFDTQELKLCIIENETAKNTHEDYSGSNQNNLEDRLDLKDLASEIYSINKHDQAGYTSSSKPWIYKNDCIAYIYTLLGHEFSTLKAYELAVFAYSRAMYQSPSMYNAYYGLGMVYLQTFKSSLSKKYLEHAISKNSSNPMLYCSLALVISSKDFNKALELYVTASVLNSNMFNSAINLHIVTGVCELYYKNNHYMKCANLITNLPRLEALGCIAYTTSYELTLLLAKSCYKLGLLDLAYKHFMSSYQLLPTPELPAWNSQEKDTNNTATHTSYKNDEHYDSIYSGGREEIVHYLGLIEADDSFSSSYTHTNEPSHNGIGGDSHTNNINDDAFIFGRDEWLEMFNATRYADNTIENCLEFL
ncbi:Cell division cycle protein 27-like protein [Zancudomyces culisetae]|uniref:Cell division cycle protein 27-like protein n=1 Tax=Zancudomyces culisetae TaxID=1213189 RepID=A0A1R1PII4_ZANCU|nr:Cell division cycle protein 27-like protein [Zancudomyces culisetae]|eukprot:OMH80794.1 Cell division cycle protein 27-like protein [Zancudomyces culisetae]